jgi:cation diffusion facilitator CzcD-associated flavoprotein CzcO
MFTLGYDFAPWHDKRSIVGGEAILGYLDEVIDSGGLRQHMCFGQTVLAADWDSSVGMWSMRMRDEADKTTTLAARFLFLGSGYYDYDDPHDAQLLGLENFDGQIIHPQFWPENSDYTGKKVIVIGSGATAATLVPAMADKAARRRTALRDGCADCCQANSPMP